MLTLELSWYPMSFGEIHGAIPATSHCGTAMTGSHASIDAIGTWMVETSGFAWQSGPSTCPLRHNTDHHAPTKIHEPSLFERSGDRLRSLSDLDRKLPGYFCQWYHSCISFADYQRR
jgi:hypothetical protein